MVLLMPRRLDDPGNHNWAVCGNKKKSLVARAWLQWLSSSPSSPRALSIPHSTSDSSEGVVMSSNLVNQSLEDQFLHWRQDMERKQEEQTRKMKELQSHVERLQRENEQSQT